MKFFWLSTLLSLFTYTGNSQTTTGANRSTLNPSLFPFYHGVASGDPLTDRVIIWSRITLDNPTGLINVGWQIFADTTKSNILQQGTITTDSSVDFTLKVDVTNLLPGTWYYYRFVYDTFFSVLGRTRTLPVGSTPNIRFAVASCQDYQSGFYNAHRHIAQRNDLDAVLFLGDYTYEDGANNNPIGNRFHEPDKKTVLLPDYRIRQSLYHLDPDLQAAHQQYPWIVVWDDHESTNNSYTDSAKNHTANDGSWYVRKTNAVKAFNEWMPIRTPDAADTFRIFRRFTWGDLLDLHMLDTRLYDRSRQAGTTISINTPALNDSTRTMVGPVQFNWLETNMQNSTAKWQLLGQQVMMTPLIIPAGVLGVDPFVVNGDQWDGYPFERQKLYDIINSDSIKNIVVLTGDIHTAWANDLPQPGYDSLNKNKSIGVEFVAPSITSGNELPPLITAPVITSLAEHVRYVELVQHGYYVLDVTPQKTQADFVYVSTIESQSYTTNDLNHYCVNDGETWLSTCGTSATPLEVFPPLAETPQVLSSVQSISSNLTAISIQPNPAHNYVQIQFNCFKEDEIGWQLLNTFGQVVMSEMKQRTPAGVNVMQISLDKLPAGIYQVVLTGEKGNAVRSVLKN